MRNARDLLAKALRRPAPCYDAGPGAGSRDRREALAAAHGVRSAVTEHVVWNAGVVYRTSVVIRDEVDPGLGRDRHRESSVWLASVKFVRDDQLRIAANCVVFDLELLDLHTGGVKSQLPGHRARW
jgi:hypothetical protein